MTTAVLLVLVSVFVVASCDFGLINLLYWKADANLDHIISKAELQTIWHDFDKNKDKNVTEAEYIPLWMSVTGQSREKSIAYFLLADLNDDEVIDQTDIDQLYKLFDQDGNGKVSAIEFSMEWQRIIKDMPFAVMFEHGDMNHDEVLTQAEFNKGFFYLDHNHNMELSMAEFTSQWVHHGLGSSHQAQELFQKLDANKDHMINHVDLTQLYKKYDANGNHQLTLHEFLKVASLVPALHSHHTRSSEIQYEIYLFDAVDADNSTYLDKHELNDLFLIFDANKDKQVLKAEFVAEWVTTLQLGSKQQANLLFSRADINSDGHISSSDLVQIFKYFDANGDNKIDTNEFLTQWGALKLGPVNPEVIG